MPLWRDIGIRVNVSSHELVPLSTIVGDLRMLTSAAV